MKQSKSLTRANVERLIKASYELLLMAMFQYWEHNGEDNKDPSERDAIEEMRLALFLCSIKVPTYEKFRSNLEDMIHSGQHPKAWVKAKKKNYA